MKKSVLNFAQLSGAVYACGFVEAGAGADEQFAKEDERATDAKAPLIEMREIVRHGGVIVAFTRKELRAVQRALGLLPGSSVMRDRESLEAAYAKLGYVAFDPETM